MNYSGSCKCKLWSVDVFISESLEDLNPRACDCAYCQASPSSLISEPSMVVELHGESTDLAVQQNGDKLASFYRCDGCDELLAVGCVIDGQLRGAVNAKMLDHKGELGNPVKVKPRLLSSAEKLERWGKLWGRLKGV